jgi:hypothetical protein
MLQERVSIAQLPAIIDAKVSMKQVLAKL